MTETLQLPFGGEIWKQSRFPYMTRYIVTGAFGMAVSSDPREQGNTIYTTMDGEWQWTQEDLAAYLNELDYVCCGQLKDVLLEDKYPGHFDEIAAIPGRKPSTRRWEGHTD